MRLSIARHLRGAAADQDAAVADQDAAAAFLDTIFGRLKQAWGLQQLPSQQQPVEVTL